jgi:hypothetical protein
MVLVENENKNGHFYWLFLLPGEHFRPVLGQKSILGTV